MKNLLPGTDMPQFLYVRVYQERTLVGEEGSYRLRLNEFLFSQFNRQVHLTESVRKSTLSWTSIFTVYLGDCFSYEITARSWGSGGVA